MKSTTVLSLVIGLALVNANNCSFPSSQFDPACYSSDDVITRDVAIIGGGSSGTYGAIKLGDMGQSVVVIEKEPMLGGHVDTYITPNGTAIDYGILAFWNTSLVTDFFARFNIPLIKYGPTPGVTPVYIDFKTGQTLTNFTTDTNLIAYSAQLDKYPELPYGWDLPSPVPEDLLLTFGDFVNKYSLQDVAFTIYNTAGAGGLGNILQQLTVTVLKAVDQVFLSEIQGASVTTSRHDNHELWDKAQAELGSNVLLSSTVIAAKRPLNSSGETGVTLVVQTPDGNKLIMASQILISIPLELDNMRPFNLDEREQSLFEQFNNTGYYSGLVTNTGLPVNFDFVNVGAETLYNIPSFPGLYFITPTRVDGVFLFWYGSPGDLNLPEARVKSDVSAAIQVLRNASKTEQSNQQPEFLAYMTHTPFNLNVPAEAISSGFYENLNSIQGYRNTWYTGALFTPASGTLWVFTQSLLPKIIASI
ncbi:hypothetical protein MMC14_009594 [Varicellaria rhodocarpa]|nr:hypothetical protein [Varicellaria rhodocarpa]